MLRSEQGATSLISDMLDRTSWRMQAPCGAN